MRINAGVKIVILAAWTSWAAGSILAETPDVAPLPADSSAGSAQVSNTETNASADLVSDDAAIARLRELAYGKESDGEFKEPSERIREAAKHALQLMGDDGKPLHKKTAPTAGQTSSEGFAQESLTSDTDGQVRLANLQAVQPPTPEPSPNSAQPPTPEPTANTSGGSTTSTYSDPFAAINSASTGAGNEAKAANTQAPVTGEMNSAKAQIAGNPDTASALSETQSAGNVDVQRRSSVTFDPHINGYKWGQVYTDMDGAYWTPARLDMDTMLSKIDPSMIDNVTVIPGPYGLRYGPGMAFIDVTTAPTPRFDCFESNYESSLNVRSNGGQINARETAAGGGADWGYRGSYGERDGSDYYAGNGQKMPSAFHAHDAWGEVGYDFDAHLRADFTYNYVNMQDTQIPGQIFDIHGLASNGFQMKVVNDDPTAPWKKATITGWYNATGFNGNTNESNDPSLPIIDRINYSLDQQFANSSNAKGPLDPTNKYFLSGITDGFQNSSGIRMNLEFGDKDQVQLRTGVDCRYVTQTITENFTIDQIGGIENQNGQFGTGNQVSPFDTNMPLSSMVDPGVYAEMSLPVTERWTVSIGGRVDYVQTSALASQLRLGPDPQDPSQTIYVGSLFNLNEHLENVNILERSDVLPAFYLTNRYKLGEHWTLTGGFGESERPPTLIERYADGIFLSTLQTGFTHVVGDPQLNPEQDWQVDVGLSADYEGWRSQASMYYAWVRDYITYTGQSVIIPASTPFSDARVLYFTNTPLATLAGFEVAEEVDINKNITPFAKVAYTQGQDVSLGGPLPGMSPLTSAVGFRFHDSDKGSRWGVETAVQIALEQTRLGEIEENGQPTTVETNTPAYAVCNLRGYYNYTKNLSFVAGVDNLFNTNYQTALDLRYQTIPASGGPLPGPGVPPVHVLEPGTSAYFGVNWKF